MENNTEENIKNVQEQHNKCEAQQKSFYLSQPFIAGIIASTAISAIIFFNFKNKKQNEPSLNPNLDLNNCFKYKKINTNNITDPHVMK